MSMRKILISLVVLIYTNSYAIVAGYSINPRGEKFVNNTSKARNNEQQESSRVQQLEDKIAVANK